MYEFFLPAKKKLKVVELVSGASQWSPTPSSFYFDYKLGRLVGGSSVIDGNPLSFFLNSFMRIESFPILKGKGRHGI